MQRTVEPEPFAQVDGAELERPSGVAEEAIGEGLDRIGHGLDDATLRRGANSEPPAVTDGPFAEAKELFNGFWILDVASKTRPSSGDCSARWVRA